MIVPGRFDGSVINRALSGGVGGLIGVAWGRIARRLPYKGVFAAAFLLAGLFAAFGLSLIVGDAGTGTVAGAQVAFIGLLIVSTVSRQSGRKTTSG
jgi:hypothetical protein